MITHLYSSPLAYKITSTSQISLTATLCMLHKAFRHNGQLQHRSNWTASYRFCQRCLSGNEPQKWVQANDKVAWTQLSIIQTTFPGSLRPPISFALIKNISGVLLTSPNLSSFAWLYTLCENQSHSQTFSLQIIIMHHSSSQVSNVSPHNSIILPFLNNDSLRKWQAQSIYHSTPSQFFIISSFGTMSLMVRPLLTLSMCSCPHITLSMSLSGQCTLILHSLIWVHGVGTQTKDLHGQFFLVFVHYIWHVAL